MIRQVQKLNPDIADVDRLDVGQTIRLPKTSAYVASDAASAAGTN
jgi:hypothetical protein